VSRYRLRYKGNFHGQVRYAPIFEIGRFLSQVAQSLSGLATPNLDGSVLTVCAYWGPHTKRKIKYGKELCLLAGGGAKARHEERRTSTKKAGVSLAPVFRVKRAVIEF